MAASHCKASYLSSTGMLTPALLKVNDFSEYKEMCVSVLKQCDLCVDKEICSTHGSQECVGCS